MMLRFYWGSIRRNMVQINNSELQTTARELFDITLTRSEQVSKASRRLRNSAPPAGGSTEEALCQLSTFPLLNQPKFLIERGGDAVYRCFSHVTFLCLLPSQHLPWRPSKTRPLMHCEILFISSSRACNNLRLSSDPLAETLRREIQEAVPNPFV